jgi:muconolactone delta-isomerase
VEFLVEFEVTVPAGTPQAEVERRQNAEAAAAADLAAQGHILRVWNRSPKVLGLYRADDRGHLDAILASLPLYDWFHLNVTPLDPHPNDPAASEPQATDLPMPRLTQVYRLEATLSTPIDLGDLTQGRRRIVALSGGTFTGPEIRGRLLPGASADWQIALPDGTALGDIRYTLQTDDDDVLYIQSSSTRYGDPEVLARLGRGETVDPSEYIFRALTRIETAARRLAWMNKGVFVTVGARRPSSIVYETYLVQ